MGILTSKNSSLIHLFFVLLVHWLSYIYKVRHAMSALSENKKHISICNILFLT